MLQAADAAVNQQGDVVETADASATTAVYGSSFFCAAAAATVLAAMAAVMTVVCGSSFFCAAAAVSAATTADADANLTFSVKM